MIVPPPGSCGTAKDRAEEPGDVTVVDWFFSAKAVSAERGEQAIAER